MEVQESNPIIGYCKQCDIWGELKTTCFEYDVECSCCNNEHKEYIAHCVNCEAIKPEFINIKLKSYKNHKKFIDLYLHRNIELRGQYQKLNIAYEKLFRKQYIDNEYFHSLNAEYCAMIRFLKTSSMWEKYIDFIKHK